jgi:cytochrome bd-type quinol oxidase subunit 2
VTTAQKLMFGFGLVALLIGGNVLAVRTERETERYARRLGGIMLLALGACLALFAIGLAGPLEN